MISRALTRGPSSGGPGTIIPVAGGKGGVGKSFVTANLAMALAQEGQDVVVADLDLGNPNLHSYLGLANKHSGVGEFLAGDGGRLAERLVETAVPGLRFLPGAGRMPFMANLTYHQKRRLMSQLEAISCDYLLLDLSAGTAFNTLDLALSADSALLVTTPERTAVLSLLTFVKNLLLRATDRSIGKDPELIVPLKRLYVQAVDEPVVTVPGVLAELGRVKPSAADQLRALCRRLRPRLIYNMGDDSGDLAVLPTIERTLSEILGLGCDHIGFLPFDPLVRKATRAGRPFLMDHGESDTGAGLRRIAQRIVRFWAGPIPGSAERLRRHAEGSRSRAALDSSRG